MGVVGIDLGTTNTVVACVRQGKVHVLADEHGSRLLPSVVSFHPNGEVLVGASAKARRVIDPRNTVYSHKRLIGRSWGSPEIAQAKQRFAFELREGPGQGPLVHARQQDYTLPEISAFVLKRAKQIAETALGMPVERAVITVPAHFNELQRASTKVAGRVAGLEVLRILNEPTAAALAYGLGRTGSERVAVYDFGGGTFDCTLLDLNGNVFEVLATAGDSFLGGDDVDNLIAERMAESYLKAHRYDPRSDVQMSERLKTTAEEMKVALSSAETHTVVLNEFGFGTSGSSVHYTFTLSRRELDAMIAPLVERSFKVTQDALSLARLTPTSFDKVILVGGSTRIPLVRQRVEAFFGAPPMDRVNPDEVVAIGAAIQAAALTDGTRRRSIPAPPPPMGASPATERGLGTPSGSEPEPFALDTDPSLMETSPGAFRTPFGHVSDLSLITPTATTPADLDDSIQTEAFTRKDAQGNLRGRMPPPAATEPNLPAVSFRNEPSPASRTAAMPGRPLRPPPPPAPPAPPRPVTAPMAAQPAPQPSGFPRTAPMAKGFSDAPPMFGTFPSAPPGASAYEQQQSYHVHPGAPPAPQNLDHAAPVLVDVTPRALVVETAGSFTDTIIPRNSKIPCERTRRFATSRDGQTTVRVRVAQGEHPFFPHNTYLGEVELSGLRPAPRGELVVAVTFEVDADGIMRVRARDVQTGQEALATLQLIGIADESSIALMINRFAKQPVGGGGGAPHG